MCIHPNVCRKFAVTAVEVSQVNFLVHTKALEVCQLLFTSSPNCLYTPHVRIFFCHCAQCLIGTHALFSESISYCSAMFVLLLLCPPVTMLECSLQNPQFPQLSNVSHFCNFLSIHDDALNLCRSLSAFIAFATFSLFVTIRTASPCGCPCNRAFFPFSFNIYVFDLKSPFAMNYYILVLATFLNFAGSNDTCPIISVSLRTCLFNTCDPHTIKTLLGGDSDFWAAADCCSHGNARFAGFIILQSWFTSAVHAFSSAAGGSRVFFARAK